MGGCASSKTTDDRDEKKIKTTKSNTLQLNQTKFSNISNDNNNKSYKNEYLINNNSNNTTTVLTNELFNEFFEAVGNGELKILQQILNSFEDKKRKKYKHDLLNAGMSKADGLTAVKYCCWSKA